MYRDSVFQVRFSPEDRAAVDQIALHHGIDKSAAVRAAIYYYLLFLSEGERPKASGKTND